MVQETLRNIINRFQEICGEKNIKNENYVLMLFQPIRLFVRLRDPDEDNLIKPPFKSSSLFSRYELTYLFIHLKVKHLPFS